MDVFSPALFQQQRIFSGTDFFWNGAAPPRGPDVEDDLAQCHRLNQSTTARCVTGRSHGYLAATATAVNMSCQTVMDENKRKQEKNNSGLSNRNGSTGVQTALGWRPRSAGDSGRDFQGKSRLSMPRKTRVLVLDGYEPR